MTMTEFAQSKGISRKTLYAWQKQIPDFWERVTARTREIYTKSRRQKIYNGLMLRAMKGDAPQAALLLAHFPDAENRTWQPPAQRHDVKVSGGVVDLLNQARAREAELDEPIEAEVLDVPSPTDG